MTAELTISCVLVLSFYPNFKYASPYPSPTRQKTLNILNMLHIFSDSLSQI